MGTLQSYQNQKTLAQIYRGLAPEIKREVAQSYGLSVDEITIVERTGIIPSHRIAARQLSAESQQNNRFIRMYMTWHMAIERFKISKIYWNTQLSDIEKLYPSLFNVAKQWVENPTSLYLSGSTGSGKTYFCFSLIRALLEKEIYNWIIFVRSDDLDNELLKAVEDRQEQYCLEKYQEVPILFIDDLGVERINDRIIKQYYSIIDRRLGNLLPTVFTSNISIDKIAANLGDRIASRLEMTTEIKFPKKDLRKGSAI